MFCREQVARFLERRADFEARGARVVLVGNGGLHFARAFAEDFHVTVPLYVDPERVAYQAAGFRSDLGSSLNPRVFAAAARALAAGHRQVRTQGTATQHGGVLVVVPGGKVLYHFVSAYPGHHPPEQEVLAALPAAA